MTANPAANPTAETPSLETLRAQLDSIDTKIIELLNARAEVAIQVGEWKRLNSRPAFDGVRQRELLESIQQRSAGKFPNEGLRNVFTEIMSACRNLEQAERIAYLGPEATFSHQAAIDEFGVSGEFMACEKIPDIFESVEKGRAHHGVVPIENSTGGVIYDTLDRFLSSNLRICAERSTPVELHLMANCAFDEIDAVYSHPQPFSQSRNWLNARLPKARQVHVESTVRGAEIAATTPRAAAIASELASKKLRLTILERGIQDVADNVTRFWIIGRETAHPTGNDKTSILFLIKDRPGALFEILQPFNELGVNLTKIESRPSRRGRWQYAFFVDFLGHFEDAQVKKALERLESSCEEIRILGSYPRDAHS